MFYTFSIGICLLDREPSLSDLKNQLLVLATKTVFAVSTIDQIDKTTIL